MIYNNVFEMIGNTPIIKLKTDENSADLYAKLEFFNPGGSVKDRVAFQMIEAIKDKINENTVLVEPTSGNTGIGIAMVCASLGIKCKLVMPETMSVERRKILKAYGAEIILTSGAKGMAGAIEKADEISKKENHIMLSQFTNENNVLAHKLTTAKEIIKDFNDLDYFIAAIGTGGTITGVSSELKLRYPFIKTIGVEPSASPFLTKGEKGPHKIQGIGAGFQPEILNRDIIDEILTVSNEDAIEYAKKLGTDYGILAGFSGGANYFIAQEIAKQAGKGRKVLFVIPDNGERYLSTELYNE